MESIGIEPEMEEKKSGEDLEYHLLVFKCEKCWGYTDYLNNGMCLYCHCHPWTWDLALNKKKKMVTASW